MRTILSAPHGLLSMTVKKSVYYCISHSGKTALEREGMWKAPGRAGSPKVCLSGLWLHEATIAQGERVGSPSQVVIFRLHGAPPGVEGGRAQPVSAYDLVS